MGHLIEKQMYKHGVYDGMRLILDGLQKVWKLFDRTKKMCYYIGTLNNVL